MQLLDARRLTGPNLLSRSPQVVVELGFDSGEDAGAAVDPYLIELARMRTALGFSGAVTPTVRVHLHGADVGYDAAIDVMLACAEMSEWAALSACETLAGRPPLPLEPKQREVEEILRRDRNPRLVALQAEAERRGLPFLWDDESVSIGAGSGSKTYSRTTPPDPAEVPWGTLTSIPIALVTGTNGKTTCTRLLARIAREAGVRVGSASSDEIAVGAEVIDTGDCTGPAAARTVLRRSDVDLAVLETARGGILRRGLAVSECDAALITNVSDDHLGGYGIDDLPAMTRVKSVIAHAVRATGTVVVSAHDPKLVQFEPAQAAKVVFFANLERDDATARAVLKDHRTRGKSCVFAEDGGIYIAAGADSHALVRVDAVPITCGGAAAYNVDNVLACVAMALALGIGDEAIVRGLLAFQLSDNPGRGELSEHRGVRVLLDFGHNAEGIRAVLEWVARLRQPTPGRLTVIAGAAGDRSNRDFEEVAQVILSANPDRVLLRDLPGYLRGRAPGEVPGLFQSALTSRGVSEARVEIVESEVAGLAAAFEEARPGDLVVVLVHLERAAVHAFLDALPE